MFSVLEPSTSNPENVFTAKEKTVINSLAVSSIRLDPLGQHLFEWSKTALKLNLDPSFFACPMDPLETEAHFVVFADTKHFQGEFIADGKEVFDVSDEAFADFGNVDQTVGIFPDANECPIWLDSRDFPGDDVAFFHRKGPQTKFGAFSISYFCDFFIKKQKEVRARPLLWSL
jgi:hypothetical protein